MSEKLILENQIRIMEALILLISSTSKGLIPEAIRKELEDQSIQTRAYLRAIA